MAKLNVPEVLLRFVEPAERELNVPIRYLNELSSWVQKSQPNLYQIMFDQSSPSSPKMNGFLNLYIEDSSVTYQLFDAIPLSESSSLRLVTSISGG